MKKVKINGVTWRYGPETISSWEEWEVMVKGLPLRVQKIYPETTLIPGNFDRSEWRAGYEVSLDYDELLYLPLDTPIEEVLARAIVEVRMK